MRTIEDMVQQEIMCCMSSLVSTLARGAYCLKPLPGTEGVSELMEQAVDLAAPVPDYEEAALQAGWEPYTDKFGVSCWRKDDMAFAGQQMTWAGTAENLCSNHEIEPYDWEVYEHWAVTTWLAERLIEQGEKVDTDFASLNVWARTNTGQAISMDGCIKKIYDAMMAPVE